MTYYLQPMARTFAPIFARVVALPLARNVAVLIAAALLAVPARATLVVVVPSRDGLVVAADSRISFLGAQCDGAFKIIEAPQPMRTVAVVTGDSLFVSPPPPRETEPCRYLETAPRRLDIDAVVRAYLEHAANSDSPVSDSRASGPRVLDGLSAACVRAVEHFRKRYPEALRGYAGKDIFSVVVASYDPASHQSTLRNFVVRIDARTLRVAAARIWRTAIAAQDRRGVWIYGETSYVERNVYGGFGRRFLSPATLSFLDMRTQVAETPMDQAVAAATDILKATIRMAETIPAPSGIGGAIRMVVLDSSPGPEPAPYE